MPTWRGEAILLAARRHGERDAIVEMLGADGGRWAGVVKGGAGRRLAATLQPGDTLAVEWRARLDEHLGTARVETARGRAAAIMEDAGRLAALGSAAALLVGFLPEREPCAGLFDRTAALMEALALSPEWPAVYALWELALLGDLGFGLDLERCAATGATEGLVWVSPRSGRAVGAEAGAPYAERLLALPGFLRGQGPTEREDVAAALRLTGHFLDAWAAPAFGAERAPAARARLAARFGV
jgi:DNA repair protein RecO (recombination protein O)